MTTQPCHSIAVSSLSGPSDLPPGSRGNKDSQHLVKHGLRAGAQFWLVFGQNTASSAGGVGHGTVKGSYMGHQWESGRRGETGSKTAVETPGLEAEDCDVNHLGG